METIIFNRDGIDRAAQLLQEGELVAFPTETVYGLGARADQASAVAKVFEAKGRPSDNPLIVHIADRQQLEELVEEVSDLAIQLMDHFWPGPLTIIFPLKSGAVADNVTGGKTTVAIRMPNNALTLELIRKTHLPLVGPSANLSTKPSPTSVEHILADFKGLIAGVLAAETDLTEIGVESTVVYPHDEQVDILRPGMITKSMIEELGISANYLSEATQLSHLEVASPGVKYSHYSPKQPVVYVASPWTDQEWQEHIGEVSDKIGLLAGEDLVRNLSSHPQVVATYSWGEAEDIRNATRNLYAGLRYLERTNCDKIYVQGLENSEKASAFINRVTKASSIVL
ncbi:L-threonylcarbamoyladenylate synthase [Facklamia lactis]|uniref:L-threonylcarbamoyladenylate synthase n=1 Tax=Facklamia lactis TaxID=2749967 RepID=UPI0018CDB9E7|nr:L-threonylcarbamoyladenylate synthase [Facklamia lactis]MBG9979626.1 threonylcarbamoyl-AMP synthase [Facklamia lactis]